jgi:hypothetical protein
LYYCHRFYTRPSNTRQRRSFVAPFPGATSAGRSGGAREPRPR